MHTHFCLVVLLVTALSVLMSIGSSGAPRRHILNAQSSELISSEDLHVNI